MRCLREGSVGVDSSTNRRVGFAEFGVSGGFPVLHFHGMPGGRFYDLDTAALVEHGVSLFVLERPGIGLSDPRPGRTLLDWPHDVASFADALGFEQFGVLGTSAGAPYALACAYVLPDRCRRVALACPYLPDVADQSFDRLLSPEDQQDVEAARRSVEEFRASLHQQLETRHSAWRNDPRAFWTSWLLGWPEDSRTRIEATRDRWERILCATYGGPVTVDEWIVQATPWGFRPEDITVPVAAWIGTEDQLVSVPLCEHTIARVPTAVLTHCPGEGHYLAPSWHGEYLKWLCTPVGVA